MPEAFLQPSFRNETNSQAALRSYDGWLAEVGVTSTTGWRWRRKGWLRVINISGRLYVTADAIAEFSGRATTGEFAQEHKVPKRKV